MSATGKTVRVAVLGLGYMGAQHLETLRRLPEVRVVAVADLDPTKIAAARASIETGEDGRAVLESPVATFARWEDLLHDGDFDALVVCTPPKHHLAPAAAAMEKGVHVYLEKPVARRGEDAARLAAAANRSGVVCAVGYQWRAIDFLDELRAELSGRQLGLIAGRSLGPALSRSWFVNWEEGGGILFELASHDIDLQRAIGGTVVAVQAAASDVPLSGESPLGFRSVLSITLEFESGALGSVAIACGPTPLPSWTLEIVAAQSAFHLDLDPHFKMHGISDGREVTRTAERPPAEASLERFVEAVRTSDPALVCCDLEQGARTLAVVLACEQALVTGGTVAVREGEFASLG